MKKKFGELLLERRLITHEQLADALSLQRRRGMRLGAALVARGHITEAQLVEALGGALGLKVVDLSSVPISGDAIKLISHRFALEHELFPYALRKERGRKVLSIAMSDPLNFRVIDELGFMTDAQIETVLAKPSDIDSAITKHYGLRSRQSEAYGRDASGADLLSLASAEGEKTTMTILRKGGGEEVVETSTGKVISPFIRGADGSLLDNPEVNLPRDAKNAPKRDEEVSAVLLTEEVADSTPVDPRPFTALLRDARPAADALLQFSPPPAGAVAPQVTGAAQIPQPRGFPVPHTGPLPPLRGGPQPVTAPVTSPVPVPVAPASSQGAIGKTKTGSMPAMPPPPPPKSGNVPVLTAPQIPQVPAGVPTAPQSSQSSASAGVARPQTGTMPVLAPSASSPSSGIPPSGSPYFDDALGALLDAAGGAVNAEAFFRLERKFWALMRVLAKKGLLSNEDFMKELGEEDR